MSSSSELATRAYEHACGVLDRMSHGYGVPIDPFATLRKLADGYANANSYLREISHADGNLDTAMVEVDRMCQVIRDAAMAVVIRCFRSSWGTGSDKGDINVVRDRLVDSFGLAGGQADVFVNLLELSQRGELLEPAFRGSGGRVVRILDAFHKLTFPRGEIDFSKILAEAESEPETASA